MTAPYTLYLIGPPEGPYKLGYTREPDAMPTRYSYQLEAPLRLLYVAYYPTGDAARRAVQEARAQLKCYRDEGGWYYCAWRQALHAVSLAGEIEGATEAWAVQGGHPNQLKEFPLLWHKNKVGSSV